MLNSHNQDKRLKQQTHYHQRNRVREVRTPILDPHVSHMLKDQIYNQGSQWKIKCRGDVIVQPQVDNICIYLIPEHSRISTSMYINVIMYSLSKSFKITNIITSAQRVVFPDCYAVKHWMIRFLKKRLYTSIRVNYLLGPMILCLLNPPISYHSTNLSTYINSLNT